MGWTAPKTWGTGELVTAAMLNTHLRDDLLYLAARPIGLVNYRKGSDFTTITGTTFTDVDATNLSGTITTIANARLLIFFHCFATATAGAGTWGAFDIALDGTRLGNTTDGSASFYGGPAGVMGVAYAASVSAGLHTFKLQARASSAGNTVIVHGNTVTIRAVEL